MAKVIAVRSIGWTEAGWDETIGVLESAAHEVRAVEPGEGSPRLAALVGDAAALLVEITPVPASVIERAPKLRVIGKGGAGVDSIDVAAATERGILVCNTPGSNSVSVAEHTLALLLALTRRLRQLDEATRKGRGWDPWPPAVGEELAGRQLGVVGTGQTGRAVIRRARAFDLHIVAHDTQPDPDLVAEGVRYVPLDELLATSEVVTLHVPLTPETEGLIDRVALERMPRGAYLINVSRGGVVEEGALLEALETGRLAGAGLDVFAVEPALDHPLFQSERVMLTPHAAGLSHAAIAAARIESARNIVAVLEGRPPMSVVNPRAGGGVDTS